MAPRMQCTRHDEPPPPTTKTGNPLLIPKLKTRRFVGSGGLSLAADVGGDPAAPTVIFMHGGGQTRHSWGGAMRQLLAEGYCVISLDARGHGDSDWSPTGDYGLPFLAADLLAVIATLSTRPALVGASLGGSTGLYAVGNSAAPIARALVLVDIVPRVDPVGAEKILEFMRSRPDGFATPEEAADAVAAYNPHRPRPKGHDGTDEELAASTRRTSALALGSEDRPRADTPRAAGPRWSIARCGKPRSDSDTARTGPQERRRVRRWDHRTSGYSCRTRGPGRRRGRPHGSRRQERRFQ